MKRRLAAILLAAVTLLLCACDMAGDIEAETQIPEPTQSAEPVLPTDEILPEPPALSNHKPKPVISAEPKVDPISEQAGEILSEMSLDEKLYQLFIVSPSAVTGMNDVSGAADKAQAGLDEYPVGGFLLSTANIQSKEQVSAMIDTLQGCSRFGLFICADEEGGQVKRLMGRIGTTDFSSMLSYKDEGTETAFENARVIASDMTELGFNLDLAPVADVWSNPANKVIGSRAYSDDFLQAAELIPSAVAGFHAGGIACCLKHFPGHGDTSEDSHKSSAYVTKSQEELWQQELLPFIAGIDAGADMVMIGHITVESFDSENPASVSEIIINGLLRTDLGYNGVVITDGLGMGALSSLTDGEKAVMAINAGADILLCPDSLTDAVEGMKAALSSGTLTEERIDESVLRILKLKLTRGIIELHGE